MNNGSVMNTKLPHLLSIAALVVLGGLGAGCRDTGPVQQPTARTAAAPGPQTAERPPFVGTLGGMKVRIPDHFVRLMEFSGEPTDWKRGPTPQDTRPTGATRDISSFGFEVKYPQMEGLATPALRQEHYTRPVKMNAWMDVSITSGDLYRPIAVEVRANHIRRPAPDPAYEVQPSDVPRLVRHVALGVNAKTGEPLRYDPFNPDVYVETDSDGRARTVIHCTNTLTGRQACAQYFLLEPDARAFVRVYFGRDMLPHWEDIQQRTRALLLSFRIE